MMRALWTAASGMTAQQLNVDNISNNISNVNTTGYKKERVEFKSLLYQTMERASINENTSGKPVNLQVGLGVRPVALNRNFSTGSFQSTENKLDFAIDGEGFFMVKTGEEEFGFTKDGSFKFSVSEDGNTLVTSEGYQVLDSNGEEIIIPSEVSMNDIQVDDFGNISYTLNGEIETLDGSIGLFQFPNPQGLEAVGGNIYLQTISSGEAINEVDGDINNKSSIVQGYIELSNVNIAEEMINLIVAQRAYDLNSKAITTSDSMLQQANNLKN